MALELPSKAPGDISTYVVDYSALLSGAELIATVISEVADAGITLATTIGSPATSLNLALSGGSELETYRMIIVIETDTGAPARRIERAYCIQVKPVAEAC